MASFSSGWYIPDPGIPNKDREQHDHQLFQPSSLSSTVKGVSSSTLSMPSCWLKPWRFKICQISEDFLIAEMGDDCDKVVAKQPITHAEMYVIEYAMLSLFVVLNHRPKVLMTNYVFSKWMSAILMNEVMLSKLVHGIPTDEFALFKWKPEDCMLPVLHEKHVVMEALSYVSTGDKEMFYISNMFRSRGLTSGIIPLLSILNVQVRIEHVRIYDNSSSTTIQVAKATQAKRLYQSDIKVKKEKTYHSNGRGASPNDLKKFIRRHIELRSMCGHNSIVVGNEIPSLEIKPDTPHKQLVFILLFGHWVDLVFDHRNEEVIFFDSFGRSPSENGFSLRHVFDNSNYKLKWSRLALQNEKSLTCGHYSSAFALWLSGKAEDYSVNFEDFYEFMEFDKDRLSNDKIVVKYICM